MKKIKLLLVCLLIIATLLTACKPDGGEGNKTDEPETDAPKIEKTYLTTGGVSKYTVVVPTGASDTVFNLAGLIRMMLSSNGGGQPMIKADYAAGDESAYEILVGYTSLPQSSGVLDEIGFFDSAVRVVGNKIVIAAHTEQGMQAVIEEFLNTVIKTEVVDGVEEKYIESEYTRKSDVESFFGETSPSECAVVYQKGSDIGKKVAEKIVARVKNEFNLELTVSDDSAAERVYEILVGNTSRSADDKVSAQVSRFGYSLTAVGKKIVLSGGSDRGLESAGDKFCKQISDMSGYSNKFDFDKGLSDKGLNYKGNLRREMTEGADVRIMSFNILCELWGDQLSIESRIDGMAGAILYYAPDVVGLQEMSHKAHAVFNSDFMGDYKWVETESHDGKINFSPIIYNSKTVKLIESDVKIYSTGNDSRLRLVTWGLFEKLSDGTRFIVTNTHWDITEDRRMVQSKEMAEIVTGLAAKYNCPVMSTGDYNNSFSGSSYQIYINNSGFLDAANTAEKYGDRTKTSHAVGTAPGTEWIGSIDHITYVKGITPLYYTVVTDSEMINTSDHCAIFADFKLK